MLDMQLKTHTPQLHWPLDTCAKAQTHARVCERPNVHLMFSLHWIAQRKLELQSPGWAPEASWLTHSGAKTARNKLQLRNFRKSREIFLKDHQLRTVGIDQISDWADRWKWQMANGGDCDEHGTHTLYVSSDASFTSSNVTICCKNPGRFSYFSAFSEESNHRCINPHLHLYAPTLKFSSVSPSSVLALRIMAATYLFTRFRITSCFGHVATIIFLSQQFMKTMMFNLF